MPTTVVERLEELITILRFFGLWPLGNMLAKICVLLRLSGIQTEDDLDRAITPKPVPPEA